MVWSARRNAGKDQPLPSEGRGRTFESCRVRQSYFRLLRRRVDAPAGRLASGYAVFFLSRSLVPCALFLASFGCEAQPRGWSVARETECLCGIFGGGIPPRGAGLYVSTHEPFSGSRAKTPGQGTIPQPSRLARSARSSRSLHAAGSRGNIQWVRPTGISGIYPRTRRAQSDT
jgi:hypothetical protein